MTHRRICIVLLASLFLASALAQADPAPATQPSIHFETQKQFTAALHDFALGQMQRNYEAHGLKDPRWDAAMRQFIVDYWAFRMKLPGAPRLEEMERRARLIYLDGCDDASLQICYGTIQQLMGHEAMATRFYRAAAESGERQKMPASFQAAAWSSWYSHSNRNGGDEAKKVAARIVDLLKAAFVNHEYAPQERPFLITDLHAMLDRAPAQTRKAAWEAIKSVPDADPVAVDLLEGEFHISAAWQSRGSGWANDVTKKGWEGFEEHLNAATTCLTRAWEADKTIPEIPTEMIAVAMGHGGPDDMRLWFDRAVAARFDYMPAYSKYVWGLYPRWHGDRASLMRLADECRNSKRYDTPVPFEYVRILLAVRQECDEGSVQAWSTPEVFDSAHEVFEKSLAPGGVFAGSGEYRSMEAAFCALAEKWPQAKQALDAVGGPLDPAGTAMVKLSPLETRGLILVHAGGGSDLLAKGKSAVESAKYADAADAFNALLNQQQDPDARAYVRGQLLAARWQADFYAGKTVSLAPDAQLGGFEAVVGRWSSTGDGAITGIGDRRQYLQMLSRADFGDSWEFTAEVQFAADQTDWNAAGIILGQRDRTNFMGLTLSPRHNQLEIRRSPGSDARKIDVDLKHQPSVLKVRRFGGNVSVFVNGKMLYDGTLPEDEPGDRFRVGLGGWPFDAENVVTFRNLTIRQFNEGL